MTDRMKEFGVTVAERRALADKKPIAITLTYDEWTDVLIALQIASWEERLSEPLPTATCISKKMMTMIAKAILGMEAEAARDRRGNKGSAAGV